MTTVVGIADGPGGGWREPRCQGFDLRARLDAEGTGPCLLEIDVKLAPVGEAQ